jgi:hypothetical protein
MRGHVAHEQALATPKYKETSVGCSLSRSGVSPVPQGGGAAMQNADLLNSSVVIDTSAEIVIESSRPKGLVKQPDHAQS